jgi:predicted CXXCH cytochrome family protein
VDCEKCHGPGAQHVTYQTQHPRDSSAKFIINPARFTRQQSLDLCALCHGGSLQKTKPSFSFVAGDKLSDFFTWDSTSQSAADIDVHGNQLGLLKFSKCFLNTTTLTCTSCHNPHQNQKNELVVFSQRCMSCHTKEHNNFCTVKSVEEKTLQNNCIDCHMPRQPSNAIAVFLPGQSVLTPSLIRTHLIKVYPEETAKYISSLKKHTDK